MTRIYYKVLFDYDGSTGTNMIPVSAGEILYSDVEQTNADWYNVVKMSDNSSGLVPANHVTEITAEEARAIEGVKTSVIDGEDQIIGNQNPSLGIRDLASSSQFVPSNDQGIPSIPPPSSITSINGRDIKINTASSNDMATGVSNLNTNTINSNSNGLAGIQNFGSGSDALPASFAEMFQRHDAYFRQVVKQREESFKKLENALAAASKDIAACKEKNIKLTQRITELDTLIEEERRKWRERLEAEKRSLFKDTQ